MPEHPGPEPLSGLAHGLQALKQAAQWKKKKKDKEEVLEVQRESPGEEILGQAVGNGLHARCPRENLTGSLGALWRIQLSAAP